MHVFQCKSRTPEESPWPKNCRIQMRMLEQHLLFSECSLPPRQKNRSRILHTLVGWHILLHWCCIVHERQLPEKCRPRLPFHHPQSTSSLLQSHEPCSVCVWGRRGTVAILLSFALIRQSLCDPWLPKPQSCHSSAAQGSSSVADSRDSIFCRRTQLETLQISWMQLELWAH